jgi:pimeloyl-ACP methyl ester carboxylesterase
MKRSARTSPLERTCQWAAPQACGDTRSFLRQAVLLLYIRAMQDLERLVEEKRVKTPEGDEIAYHVVGRGKPVVLANGLGGSWRAWAHQIRHFADRYRFISWDYRGMYQSPVPRDPRAMQVSLHAEDGLHVLRAEGISEGAGAFGWSMGVQVALEMFRREPKLFDFLVLINGVAGSPFKTLANSPTIGQFAPPILRSLQRMSGLVEASTRVAVKWPYTAQVAMKLGIASKTIDVELFRGMAGSFAGLDMEVYMRILEQLGEHDAHDVLPRITQPVLVIAGGRDLMTPRAAAERLVHSVKDGQLYVIPDGTHYLAVEYPKLLNARIERFVEEQGF